MGEVIGLVRVRPEYNRPLKKLPNINCYHCGHEIEDNKFVAVRHIYPCHPGRCAKNTRAFLKEAE